MLASQQPVWRARPRGSWYAEEAARERLRAHRRQLKNARPMIELEHRAPLPRRPVRLPGLPSPLSSGKSRKPRRRTRHNKPAYVAGRRAFVPRLQPIDEVAASRSASDQSVGGVSSAASTQLMHYGPAPPAYRPSPDLLAAIVQFQADELEKTMEQLRLRRAKEAEKWQRERDAAEQAVAEAETWGASAEVCMAMVKGLQTSFRSTKKQLLELQRQFVASRSAANVAEPSKQHADSTKHVVIPRSTRPHHQAAQPHRRARMRRLLAMRQVASAAKKSRKAEERQTQPQPQWDDAISDLAALRISEEARAERRRLVVSKHAQKAKKEVERKFGLLSASMSSRTAVNSSTPSAKDVQTVADLVAAKDDRKIPKGTSTSTTTQKRIEDTVNSDEPGWDNAISDLRGMKLSEEEQARRRASRVSRHSQRAKQELQRKRNKDSLRALAALVSEDELRHRQLEKLKEQKRNAVSNMMQQLRTKQRLKRERAERETKAQQLLKVIMGTNLRISFCCWLEWTKLNLQVSQMYRRFIYRAVTAAFESWVVLLAMGRAVRARIARAVAWWKQMQLAAAYHGWLQRVNLSQKAKRLQFKVAARWQHMQLANLVSTWQHFAAVSRGIRLLTVRIMARFNAEQVQALWHVWSNYARVACRARVLLSRVMRRWQREMLATTFVGWLESAQQQKQARVILARLRAREMLAAMMAHRKRAVWAWESWAMAAQVAQKARAIAVRVAKRDLRDRVVVIFESWAQWTRDVVEEQRREVSKSVVAEAHEITMLVVEEEAGLIAAAEHTALLHAAEQSQLATQLQVAAAATAAAVRIQARWRGSVARTRAAMLLDWWDIVIEEDAATRIQAMWRGRKHRTDGLRGIALKQSAGYDGSALLLADQSMSDIEPVKEQEQHDHQPEEELWCGELETVKSEKRGTYKWKKQYAVVFGGGENPRVEVYQSYRVATKALRVAADTASPAVGSSLVFPLVGATLEEEIEDKHETRLLRLESAPQVQKPPQDDTEIKTTNLAILRVRLDDKHRVGVTVTAADAATTALRTAIGSVAPIDRPVSGASKAVSETSISSSLYWDQLIEEDAASRIQAAWRGRQSRRLWGVVDTARGRPTSTIQRADRPWSAVSVQSISSSMSVGSSVAWQEFLENHAATAIQACWRGWVVRQSIDTGVYAK